MIEGSVPFAGASPETCESYQGVLKMISRSEPIILGRLMENNHIYPEVMFLRSSDFNDPIHGVIFDIMVAKMALGKLADATTIQDELHDTLTDVGGLAYLAHCLLLLANDGNSAGWHAMSLLETRVRLGTILGKSEAELRVQCFRNYSLTTMPYADYLATSEWQSQRERTLRLASHRCQLCGRRDCILQAHHNTYERRGTEWPCDLIALCMPCHERFHNDGAMIELDPDLVASLQATGKGWAKRLNKAIRSWMFLTGADPNKVGPDTEDEHAFGNSKRLRLSSD